MELAYTAEEKRFAGEVRDFVREHLPADIRRKMVLGRRLAKDDVVRWQRLLNQKGWAAPAWPEEYGGTGWDPAQLYIFKDEMQRGFAPDALGFNINLVGPVLIAYGSEAQKREFLPKLRNLDIWFCQGFSEPNAGSDLASLATTGRVEGDELVINGSKLWTTHAHRADWMFALVRTDPQAKKHSGISYVLIDMKTPGITLRPIVTLDGVHWCNQEFFDEVRVPLRNVVGELNKGWDYAKYLLGHERMFFGKVGASKALVGLAKEMASRISADGAPLLEQIQFREKAAALEVELKALEITNMRLVAAASKQHAPKEDPMASILKLKGSELYQAATELLAQVSGPHAAARQCDYINGDSDEVLGPEYTATTLLNYFFMRERTIAGGSSEVQRNILAKAVLGLR